MKTDVLFSSESDDWETPQRVFDELNNEFGFELDACASPENAKCSRYYTKAEDGLKQPWTGTVWCNPPYDRNIGEWIRKASASAQGGLRL